ncbi:DEAD/DEAH box helicase [Acinetobacter soli]|uniref:DEAD/DEAH box helicase n=1 Tax=Acinetobacter soli TaxID=487316 RepID=UPI003A88B537
MPKFQFLPGSIDLEDNVYAKHLVPYIQRTFGDCEGYFGYKLTSLGRDSDQEIPAFIILTKKYGIILIDIVDSKIKKTEEQNELEIWIQENNNKTVSKDYFVDLFCDEIKSRLKNEPTFYSRKKKDITIPIHSWLIFSSNTSSEIKKIFDNELFCSTLGTDELTPELHQIKSELNITNLNDDEFDKVISLLEGTYVFEDKYKIREDKKLETINDFIEESLQRTFKQDEAQRIISMQIPDGPQRIRGLAGTGKTIVLSLKAAITHKRLSDYKILYLFNTQSLYGTITQHISKYYVAEAKKAPDFENKLKILHAWGGKNRAGLYSDLCTRLGLVPKTFMEAKHYNDPLEFIYRDLLNKVGELLEPVYDMVLIDEAQDLPPALFETIYKITKDPKRIIWAYDDFQSLRAMKIKEPDILFGKNPKTGLPNISMEMLQGKYYGEIDKDFVLPNCYRTPRPVLMTAHGIAMGLYNKDKIMQPYDDREDWKAIGYDMVTPEKDKIVEGDHVQLTRPFENSKNKLEKIIKDAGYQPTDLVLCKSFSNIHEELQWIASKIKNLISSENVSPEEIIVVNINNRRQSSEELSELRSLLNSFSIRAVTPGYIESNDIFKVNGCVTLSTPFRAKGNESNIVFVFNSQKVINDSSLTARNAFFASLTRSRGWCYITGNSSSMLTLKEEIEAIKSDFPFFNFIRPDDKKIASVNKLIHTSSKEIKELEKSFDRLKENPELLLQELKNNPDLMKYISEGLK